MPHSSKTIQKKQQVYLFGTCLIDNFYPQAGLDAIALLELAGFEVIFPQAQTCCGQPPYNSGFKAPALSIAKQTIDLFSDEGIPLVVPSASCASMIKYHYPTLFEANTNDKQLALNLSQRTFELIDFLHDKLPYSQQPKCPHLKVTLHESCSALREMNVASTWHKVLEQLDNIELFFPEDRHECCGFGGTFSVKSEPISAVMTHDKSQNLLATGAEKILSGDCGCLMNIGEHIVFEKSAFKKQANPCLHLASFLVARFGLQHEH